MKKAIQLVFVVLWFLFNTGATAQVKSYTLHTSSNVYEISAAAVNSKTGDILVAWMEIIDFGSNERLWAATLKRKADGSYEVGKAVALTPNGTNAHSPVVAFSELKNRFLIVYGVGKFPVRIESRLVKRTKITSKSRVLFKDEITGGGLSMALAGVVKNSRLPSSKAQFVLAADTDNFVFGEAGVYLIMIDKKGTVKGDPLLLRNDDHTGGFTDAGHVSDIEVADNGTIYIALKWASQPTGGSVESHLGILVVDAEGNPVDTVASDPTASLMVLPKIAQLNSRAILCSWRVHDDLAVYNQRFGTNLGLLGASYKSFSVEYMSSNFGLVSDDNGTAYQYTEKGGTGVLYRLKTTGKGLDTEKTIDVPNAASSWFPMANIPGRNQLLLVTNRFIEGGKTAMLAHVISLDEVFN